MIDPTFDAELQKHAYALEVSGYTIIPAQLTAEVTQDLCRIADRALEEVRHAMKLGLEVPFQPGSRFYEAASALYCWGDSALALLEHPTVTRMAECLMGTYYLNDLTVFSALPAPRQEACVATSWHRDGCDLDSATAGQLWFFFYLDDGTAENGATWVVPGSHRIQSAREPRLDPPWTSLDLNRFPSRMQLIARAGDLAVIDARALHTSGRNDTERPRRLINLGLVDERARSRIRSNHWVIAGPRIQVKAGMELRRLLGADLSHRELGHPRSILPEGWQSG